MDKAREIAQLGEDAYRRGELHATHGLHAQYRRIEAPVDHCFAQGRFETAALREPIPDGTSIFVKGKLLPHGVERKAADPAPVIKVATTQVNAAAWLLAAMHWNGCRHPNAQLYDFTPTEASLALLMVNGCSLEAAAAAAAAAMKVKTNTVPHLRSIFQKAGVTRQAELVRTLLNSVMSLS